MKPINTIRRLLRGTPLPTEAAKPKKISKEAVASKKFARKYYSLEGEDCILRALFQEKETGYYVDVGAHHPYRYSNTAIFYERGWSGLNIDATPGSMALFNELRPRDVNIEAAVSDENRKLTYYIFDEPALNTFDAGYMKRILQIEGSPYMLKEKLEMETVTLAGLLGRHLPAKQKIDFMSVDVECHDLEVLRSNDWELYQPDIILAESLPEQQTALHSYLQSLGYRLVAHTLFTGIFEHKSSRYADRGLR